MVVEKKEEKEKVDGGKIVKKKSLANLVRNS